MSTNYIDAKVPKTQNPTEREDIPIKIFIGLFFDGVLTSISLASDIVQFYNPPTSNDKERIYSILIPSNGNQSIGDINEDDEYASYLSCQVNELYQKLNRLLNVEVSNASRLKIVIDTFAIDDGAICAAIFCDSVEPGKIKGKNGFIQKVASVVENGIMKRLKDQGAQIELNSFSHFDSTYISKEETATDELDNYGNLVSSANYEYPSQNEGEQTPLLKATISYNKVIEEQDTKHTYLYADKRTPFQKLFDRVFTWRYMMSYDLRNWVDEKEKQLSILSVATLESGAGEVMEIGCICLNGISTLISLDMAAMIYKNKRERNANLAHAGKSAIGIIPWGKIMGKCADKGFEFVLRKFSKKPNLRVIPGGGNTPSPTTPNSNVVPLFRNNEEEILKVANGPDIVIGKSGRTPLTIVNSYGDSNSINNLMLGRYYPIQSIQSTSANFNGAFRKHPDQIVEKQRLENTITWKIYWLILKSKVKILTKDEYKYLLENAWHVKLTKIELDKLYMDYKK